MFKISRKISKYNNCESMCYDLGIFSKCFTIILAIGKWYTFTQYGILGSLSILWGLERCQWDSAFWIPQHAQVLKRHTSTDVQSLFSFRRLTNLWVKIGISKLMGYLTNWEISLICSNLVLYHHHSKKE